MGCVEGRGGVMAMSHTASGAHFRASIPHGTGVSSGRADRLLLMQSHGCGPRALPASHLKRSSARPALNAGPRMALHTAAPLLAHGCCCCCMGAGRRAGGARGAGRLSERAQGAGRLSAGKGGRAAPGGHGGRGPACWAGRATPGGTGRKAPGGGRMAPGRAGRGAPWGLPWNSRPGFTHARAAPRKALYTVHGRPRRPLRTRWMHRCRKSSTSRVSLSVMLP